MDLVRVFAGWLIVWAVGVLVLRRAYARPATTSVDMADGTSTTVHGAWIAGAGFLVGAFVLTLEMSLVSRAGLRFSLATIGLPLLLIGAAAAWPDVRRKGRAGIATATSPWAARGVHGWPEHGWRGVLFALLLAWLAVHAVLLLLEVVRQPLFPWDAWTQWATKAKVWFAMGHIVPFVQAPEWLQGGTNAYYDAAAHYPATVPLWQVWSSVALGRYDDAIMNVPWWLVGVALALAIYGFLRMRGFTPLLALIGTWLIVSMPILETHIALAGYADLPLAAYLTTAVLAGLLALESPSRVHLLVAVLLAAALPLIKNPGWAWLATLVPGIVVARLPRRGMQLVIAAWLVAIVLALVLGRFEATVLNYRVHLQFDMPWHGLVEAYLSFANWHLLFWAVPAVLLVAHRFLNARGVGPLTAVVVSGALFLLLGFSLTNAAVWVEDQSTVNRATLHLAPLVAIWLMLLMQRALGASAAAPQPAATPVSAPSPALSASDA